MDAVEKSLAVEGHLDTLEDGQLRMWAWYPAAPDKTVSVDLLVNGAFAGRFAANAFRDDLLQATKGDGFHALSADISAALAICDKLSAIEIVALSTDDPGTPFASMTLEPFITGSLNISDGTYDRLRSFLAPVVKRVYEIDRKIPVTRSSSRLEGRKAQTLSAPLSEGATNLGRLSISKYSDFVRHRFNVARDFDVEAGGIEIDNFLKWYLEIYCVHRGDLRAPLSASEIAHLNQLIDFGGQKHHLSRATWIFLLNDRTLLAQLDLNSIDGYLAIVYWWSIERSKSLFVEDCLSPPVYRSALNGIRDIWRTREYPLSRFLEIYFSRNPQWHFLNLENGNDRVCWYFVIMIISIERPYLLQYVPRYWLQAILKYADDGSSYFKNIVDRICPDSDAGNYVTDYKSVMLRRDFDIDSQRSLSLTIEGHRLPSVVTKSPAGTGKQVDVQLIGPMRKASGLGQATRLSADALARGPFSCSSYDFDMDNPAPVGFNADRPLSSLQSAKINLIHLNAESVPLAFAFLPDVFTNAYNIGYFFWELDTPARCHALALELLDEVWVSSKYGVDIYAGKSPCPVINVGMSYEDIKIPDRAQARDFIRRRFAVGPEQFIFFAAFDSFSFIQRKNPQAVIRAFREAFPEDKRVRLILKTHNKDFVHDPPQVKVWRQIDEAVAVDPRIMVVNETLPYNELLLMKSGCDCYVSLHKSEGWGFGMLEAMRFGIPILATNYSGNTEFCNYDNSWLVEYRMEALGTTDYIYVTPGQSWAEPSHADAVRQMQSVVGQPEERQRRALAAQAFVSQNFSPKAIAARYSERLSQVIENLKSGLQE